jgi:hypothetical protein
MIGEKASRKTIPDVNTKYPKDTIDIKYQSKWQPLEIDLYKNGVRPAKPGPLKYGHILLEGTTAHAFGQKAEGAIST